MDEPRIDPMDESIKETVGDKKVYVAPTIDDGTEMPPAAAVNGFTPAIVNGFA